jgi:hypothetical protein
MNTFALMLVGYKKPQYFEFDTWRVDEGCLRLFKKTDAIAMFSVTNIVGLVNLDARAHLTEQEANERLKKCGIDPSALSASGEMK